jgi:hypothetical protein
VSAGVEFVGRSRVIYLARILLVSLAAILLFLICTITYKVRLVFNGLSYLRANTDDLDTLRGIVDLAVVHGKGIYNICIALLCVSTANSLLLVAIYFREKNESVRNGTK